MDLGDLRIEGNLTQLVPFSERHATDPAYAKWLSDYEVVKTLNLLSYVEHPPTIEDLLAYRRSLVESERDMFLAMHDASDDAFVGTVRAGHIDWTTKTADIGIMIGRRDRWGRGLATDSILAVARYLFDVVGLRKLTAGAMANNPGMLRTFEKLGFEREGVLREQDLFEGEYVDHIYFGCFEHELRDPRGGADEDR